MYSRIISPSQLFTLLQSHSYSRMCPNAQTAFTYITLTGYRPSQMKSNSWAQLAKWALKMGFTSCMHVLRIPIFTLYAIWAITCFISDLTHLAKNGHGFMPPGLSHYMHISHIIYISDALIDFGLRLHSILHSTHTTHLHGLGTHLGFEKKLPPMKLVLQK